MKGTDSGQVVANAAGSGEAVGKVGDVPAHSGDVKIEEVEVVVIAE